jgi:hypothetical protein
MNGILQWLTLGVLILQLAVVIFVAGRAYQLLCDLDARLSRIEEKCLGVKCGRDRTAVHVSRSVGYQEASGT